jgi:pantoate--beta-alanine ligase
VPAQLIHRRDDWRHALEGARGSGASIGLVPTMGSLHAGHLSLIRRAKAECGFVAVTVYVNPLQFGDPADLDAYPRDLGRDVAAAGEAGAAAVFAPSVGEMWPQAPATTVKVGVSAGWLEDAQRPGHFDGVATIVTKLLALAGPARAYFGEKDYQQLVVVRRLVADLSLPDEVIGCPTVRNADGLALSSRNSRLSDEQRAVAPKLYWSLLAGKRAIEEDSCTDSRRVSDIMAAAIAGEPQFGLDYAAAVDPDDLHMPDVLAGETRLLVAARLGPVRLIDNIGVTVPDRPAQETSSECS